MTDKTWWGGNCKGLLVLISSHNCLPFIQRTLFSVERCLEGQKWSLCIADDGSHDGTVDFLKSYVSGADNYIFKSYPKAAYIGEAKNRAIRLAESLFEDYPGILIMDADDLMMEDRVKKLVPFAVNNDFPLVVGGHIRYGYNYPDNGLIFPAKKISPYLMNYGLWATFFHYKLIPKDFKLFREDVHGYDDGCVNALFLASGIIAQPCPNSIVHFYLRRPGTIFNVDDKGLDKQIQDKYQEVLFEYFLGKKINLGPKKYTVYSVFEDGASVEDFMRDLVDKLSLCDRTSEIEFLILDKSKELSLISATKFPYAKHLACGMLNIFDGRGLDERRLVRIIIGNSSSESLIFSPLGANINLCNLSFLGEILKIKPVCNLNGLCAFQKSYLNHLNENNPFNQSPRIIKS